MASTATKDKIVNDLAEVSKNLNHQETEIEKLRLRRDRLFVKAYDSRAVSITKMAQIAGLRRESVHAAINRTRKEKP